MKALRNIQATSQILVLSKDLRDWRSEGKCYQQNMNLMQRRIRKF